MTGLPKALKRMVESLWASTDNLRPEDVVRAIRADSELTDAAVTYVAERVCRHHIDQVVRGVSMRSIGSASRSKAGASGQFIASVIDRGISLLDVRFGQKALGDYTPAEAEAYADHSLSAARTQAVRAHFVRAVARACPDKDRLIREQVSGVDAEAIRARICSKAPDPVEAEEALVAQ